MTIERINHVELPKSGSFANSANTTRIDINTSLVVVGANGTGKTRLGIWIEYDGPQRARTHRVAAQRLLSMPHRVNAVAIEEAEAKFYFNPSHGAQNVSVMLRDNPEQVVSQKRNSRGGNVAVVPSSDYHQLVVYLFSEQTDEAIRYRERARTAAGRVAPGETKLDRAKRLWESVLPHRELVIGSSTIETRVANDATATTYMAPEMSDGERVVFYLIGQCLMAPPAGLIVVDEPETHLHRAVQTRLWDAIEQERPDCLFVYFTHDLDFATSRLGATKVWLKKYQPTQWEWEIVPETDDLPEDVLLTVLGSRRPVMFVEGEKGGLDHTLLSAIYRDWTIVPRGTYERVIGSTSAFSSLREHHNLTCCGIIDRDYRTDVEILELEKSRIYTFAVHELENMLLEEAVLRAVATALMLNEDDVVAKVKSWVFEKLEKNKVRAVSAHAARAIEATIKKFDNKALGKDALRDAVRQAASVDVSAEYAAAERRVDDVLQHRDYTGALLLYSNKGLLHEAARYFELGPRGYLDLIKRHLMQQPNGSVFAALQQVAPQITS